MGTGPIWASVTSKSTTSTSTPPVPTPPHLFQISHQLGCEHVNICKYMLSLQLLGIPFPLLASMGTQILGYICVSVCEDSPIHINKRTKRQTAGTAECTYNHSSYKEMGVRGRNIPRNSQANESGIHCRDKQRFPDSNEVARQD